MRTNVKNWYCKEFQDDELGPEINPTLTLEGLYEGLKAGEEVFELLGVADSIVRERAFEKLARVLGVRYDAVYALWLWN